MEETKKENKNRRKGRKFQPTTPKNYRAMYEQNDDIFSLLGQSKVYEQLTHNTFDARAIIKVALNELDFNENTTPAQLSQISGIHIRTYEQLVELIEEIAFDNKQNINITNEALNILVTEVLKRSSEIEQSLKSRDSKLNPKDFIALAQYRNIAQNKISEEHLFTEQKARNLGLELPRHALPYTVNNKAEGLYGWESVKFFHLNNTLDVPMKNYYTNEWLLKPNEQTFDNYLNFKANLSVRKIKTNDTYLPVSDERPVVLDGKKLIIDDTNISQTEEAVLTMYEINKNALIEKRKWYKILSISTRDSRTKKRIKKFFKKQGYVSKEFVNSYNEFSIDKSRFYEYKEVLNDCIATLSTINYARIYMTDSTFQKVEQNLTTQASQKLAQLPRIHSSWVLPYIATRVAELSKQNYVKAGLSDEDIKQLYKQTGRNVSHLDSVDEMIFSKLDPNFIFENASSKEEQEFSKDKGSYRAYTQEEVNNMGLSKLLKKHKKMAEEQEKARASNDQTKEESKQANNKQERQSEASGTGNISLAKANLKEFLRRNLTMKGEFSNTIPIRYNKKLIKEANERNVDMEAVSDAIYKQIANDMDKKRYNIESFYRRKDKKYYLEGWRLFMDYFESVTADDKNEKKKTPTQITLFKDILTDAIELVEKHTNKDNEK